MPILAAAAREIGGVQIQNRGTLGGNIANGSPAGDTLPVLAAVDAVLVLASARETRRVPFNWFYTGYRKCVLRQDDLIAAIEIPADRRPPVVPEGRDARRAGDLEGRDGGGAGRIAADRPRAASRRPSSACRATEAVLAGGGSIAEARAGARSARSTPIDDIRSTAEYRRRVSGNLLEQFWRETA